QGDQTTLLVRRRLSDGNYLPYDYTVAIRSQGKPYYVTHPTADVSAMWIALPPDVPLSLLSLDSLATDDLLTKIEVHPDDEVFSLGFPLAATGPGAFPILRSGHIASYPLVPMKTVGQIELDTYVLDGNSGGPVYFSYRNRSYGGNVYIGDLHQGLLGIVVQKTSSAIPEFRGTSLNF